MMHATTFISTVLGFLIIANPSRSQERQIYKHPLLNIQFKAQSGWQQLERHQDDMIFETADPDQSVHVMLWYTATMQDARGYLEKMADMKGLRWDAQSTAVEGLGDEAWQLDGIGDIWGMDARTLLTVIHRGSDKTHRDHFALYIVMIWCPRDVFNRHKRQMGEIINSIVINE